MMMTSHRHSLLPKKSSLQQNRNFWVHVTFCGHHPKSVANILCFYDLNRRYGVTFDPDANQFVATTLNGSFMSFKSKGKLYVYSDGGHTRETVLVQTVSSNLQGYIKREIDRIKVAGELYVINGRPTEKDFIWMLTILNCPVTELTSSAGCRFMATTLEL